MNVLLCLLAAGAVAQSGDLADEVRFPDELHVDEEQKVAEAGYPCVTDGESSSRCIHNAHFHRAMRSLALARSYMDPLNDAEIREVNLTLAHAALLNATNATNATLANVTVAQHCAFNETCYNESVALAAAHYADAQAHHALALAAGKVLHGDGPVPTHPDGDDAVLYTSDDDARYNKEGMYLPPKRVENYSPGRTRECCENSCAHRYTDNTNNATDQCKIGCGLWLGSSSLNWESETWHVKLRDRCQSTCDLSRSAQDYHARISHPDNAHRMWVSNNWFKMNDLVATSMPECKQGCEEYLTCMYGLETTPLDTVPLNDFNSRIQLTDAAHADDAPDHGDWDRWTTAPPLVTDEAGCTTGTGTTCEEHFNGCVMHHGTAGAYCKMPVSAEFKAKYESACQYGGSLQNEFQKCGGTCLGDKHCTVITSYIRTPVPNMDVKYQDLLDAVCKYHGEATGLAGMSSFNGYFGSTRSPGTYNDEASCYATASPFAETTIAARGGSGLSCQQGRYYKYWAVPSVLACQGTGLLDAAPATMASLTTGAPTVTATTCGSYSSADSMHCTGNAIKQWPASRKGSQAECTSFCEAQGATCVVYQTGTQRCFCKDGVRQSGCNGCTARITHAASCV